MGWLRLVGSFKLLVSFAKEPYKRDYILRKRPMILRTLLIVATPYSLGATDFEQVSVPETIGATDFEYYSLGATVLTVSKPRSYGVASISRLLQNIGLLCRVSSLL